MERHSFRSPSTHQTLVRLREEVIGGPETLAPVNPTSTAPRITTPEPAIEATILPSPQETVINETAKPTMVYDTLGEDTEIDSHDTPETINAKRGRLSGRVGMLLLAGIAAFSLSQSKVPEQAAGLFSSAMEHLPFGSEDDDTDKLPKEVPYSVKAFAAVKALEGYKLEPQTLAELKVRGTYSASADEIVRLRIPKVGRRTITKPRRITATQVGSVDLVVGKTPIVFESKYDKSLSHTTSKGYELIAKIPSDAYKMSDEKLKISRRWPHIINDELITPAINAAYEINTARGYEENIVDSAAKQIALSNCADKDLSASDSTTDIERAIPRLIKPAVKTHLRQLIAKIKKESPEQAAILSTMPLTRVQVKNDKKVVLAKSAMMPDGSITVPGISDIDEALGKRGKNETTNPRGTCKIVR